jgi:hypothetical protein
LQQPPKLISPLQTAMFQRPRNWFLISALAASLVACSDASQTATNSPAETNSSPAASPVADSGSKPSAPTSTTIPGVKNASEVKFKPQAKNSPYGSFDSVNGNSNAPLHKVAKTEPIKLSGWAVLPDKKKLADAAIITLADNKTIVAVTPLNTGRADVAKALNNPAYQNSGWTVTVNPGVLSQGKVTLKAWAYDAATKEANQLGRTLDVSVE